MFITDELQTNINAATADMPSKPIATEEQAAEIEELRRKISTMETAKRLIPIAGDERTAHTLATALYGAASIDTAMDIIGRIIDANTKRVRDESNKKHEREQSSTITKEEILSIRDGVKRQRLIAENIHLFT